MAHERKKLEGFVYRVPGPVGLKPEYRWIARSVHGQVAHGDTPEEAARNLEACMEALADVAGQPLVKWLVAQPTEGSRFVRAGELVQA